MYSNEIDLITKVSEDELLFFKKFAFYSFKYLLI